MQTFKRIMRYLVAGAMLLAAILGLPLLFPIKKNPEEDRDDKNRSAQELE